MAKLERNAIELVTGVNEEEVETKIYYTPPFIPGRVVYEAFDLSDQIDDPKSDKKDLEKVDLMAEFIANRVYNGQFTKDELIDGVHGPSLLKILRDQLMFAANGFQSEAQKKLAAKKN